VRVVDQDVQAALRGRDAIEGLPERVALVHVDLVRRHGGLAELAGPARRFVEQPVRSSEDHGARAVGQHGTRQCASEEAAGPGQDHRAPLEREQRVARQVHHALRPPSITRF
jgi:hypothetical protein